MSKYDIVIKPLESLRVASIRDVVPTPPDQGMLWGELMEHFGRQPGTRMIGPPMAVYHDREFKERDWDIEVCMPILDPMTAQQRLKVYEMSGFEAAACVVHAGPFLTINEAYDAVAKWIDANGYQVTGPWREVNLRPPDPPGDQNDPNTVTEIQFPVQKV
jgi:effector-binding domain-containing protein